MIGRSVQSEFAIRGNRYAVSRGSSGGGTRFARLPAKHALSIVTFLGALVTGLIAGPGPARCQSPSHPYIIIDEYPLGEPIPLGDSRPFRVAGG